MSRATVESGDLLEITNCYIDIPIFGRIILKSLPEISDSKSAAYNDEPIIGRSFPLKTYSHSENRVISMKLHFYNITATDFIKNLGYLRAIESVVYPKDTGSDGATFEPPPVCRIKCGELLSTSPLCVILKSYSAQFPTDVAWEESTYVPFKFDVDTNWEAIYRSSDLPGQERIFSLGS